nr:NAD(P)H-dependent oxidoreductase [Pedobacter panaciterrae]
MIQFKIAILVGSLRKESWNRKMANALIALAPNSLSLEIISIGDLPLYNEDLETAPPSEWIAFRKHLASFDAVLFVTPEYNRSLPAVLKNAIDVGSRPYGKSCWDGKPGAIISVSPGNIGAFGANHHLRQSLVFLNVPAMAQPEAYIGSVATLFDDQGILSNESTKAFLTKFINSFQMWISSNIKREVN